MIKGLRSGVPRVSVRIRQPDRVRLRGRNNEDEEYDDESKGDGDVQHDVNVSPFLTLHQAMENEQGRYISVKVVGYDASNNPDHDDPIEPSPVQYHLAQSSRFENVEDFGKSKEQNIGNYGYIGTWILRIYRKYW